MNTTTTTSSLHASYAARILRAALIFLLLVSGIWGANSSSVSKAASSAVGVDGIITDASTGLPIDQVCVTVGPPIRCWTYSNAAGVYQIDFPEGSPNGMTWTLYYLKSPQFTQTSSSAVVNGRMVKNMSMTRTAPDGPPIVPDNPVQTAPPVLPGAPTAPPYAGPVPTPAPTMTVEQRIAEFWKRIDALAPAANVSAGDLGGWGLNVIERNPRARLSAADFRAATAEMQAGLDKAGLGPVPTTLPTPIPNIEQRIADFWARINALRPDEFVSAGDLGGWALNVLSRIPRAQLSATDFRASTANMQGGFDRAGLAP